MADPSEAIALLRLFLNYDPDGNQGALIEDNLRAILDEVDELRKLVDAADFGVNADRTHWETMNVEIEPHQADVIWRAIEARLFD